MTCALFEGPLNHSRRLLQELTGFSCACHVPLSELVAALSSARIVYLIVLVREKREADTGHSSSRRLIGHLMMKRSSHTNKHVSGENAPGRIDLTREKKRHMKGESASEMRQREEETRRRKAGARERELLSPHTMQLLVQPAYRLMLHIPKLSSALSWRLLFFLSGYESRSFATLASSLSLSPPLHFPRNRQPIVTVCKMSLPLFPSIG